MALSIGDMLQDRYRIVSLLGQGGMGAVYRAWDVRLNVPMALKEMVPQPDLAPDTLAQLREQFQQEAQILARLNHPYLVMVGDFFQERGNVYLAMDFVEGENLAQRIKREKALPEAQVLEWASQLLDALAYCHSQGIVHRDVKPHNVIIRPDGRVVLVDFGLVKMWDPSDPRTKTAMRGMGTPEYAPPEQYDTWMGYTDARSDIYGLGATIYHALTGQAPPTATARMSDPERFLPLRQVMPAVSKRTEAAVAKSLELTRSQRWQSTAEMAQSLGLSIRDWGEDKATRPVTAPLAGRGGTRVMETAARHGLVSRRTRIPVWVWALGGLATLVLVAVLTIGAIAMGGMWARDQRDSPTPSAVQTATAVTPTATVEKTAAPSPSPSSSPRATATPSPTRTTPPTNTPEPTSTPTPAPPTDTPVPQAISPQLLAPTQGGEYASPITFEWSGSLGAGQTYQVTAYHSGSGHTIQSELLATQNWTADLPGDQTGEWRWSVSVIQGGLAVATSTDGLFWFNPFPGGDGDGGDGGGPGATNTPAPP